MASAAAAAVLRRAAPLLLLLLLLALVLHAPAAESRRPLVDLCGLVSGHTVPGRDCTTLRCFRYDPVCGVDGVTYGCGCPEANCYGVRVVKLAAC